MGFIDVTLVSKDGQPPATRPMFRNILNKNSHSSIQFPPLPVISHLPWQQRLHLVPPAVMILHHHLCSRPFHIQLNSCFLWHKLLCLLMQSCWIFGHTCGRQSNWSLIQDTLCGNPGVLVLYAFLTNGTVNYGLHVCIHDWRWEPWYQGWRICILTQWAVVNCYWYSEEEKTQKLLIYFAILFNMLTKR